MKVISDESHQAHRKVMSSSQTSYGHAKSTKQHSAYASGCNIKGKPSSGWSTARAYLRRRRAIGVGGRGRRGGGGGQGTEGGGFHRGETLHQLTCNQAQSGAIRRNQAQSGSPHVLNPSRVLSSKKATFGSRVLAPLAASSAALRKSSAVRSMCSLAAASNGSTLSVCRMRRRRCGRLRTSGRLPEQSHHLRGTATARGHHDGAPSSRAAEFAMAARAGREGAAVKGRRGCEEKARL